MKGKLQGVHIAGIGKAVGEEILTNQQLEQMVDTSDEWIKARTGISERHIASADVATSDLATAAARNALQMAKINPEDLDLIIVATVTPDMLFPSTACLVQANLGAKNVAAMDLSAACSGFMYACSVGAQFVQSGTYENVLVIGAEVLSKITNYEDRNTCILFGDGAGAAVLRPGEGRGKIRSFYLGADGSGGNLLTQPAGGSRLPASPATVAEGKHYIHMEGSEVFKFAVRIMGDAALKALEYAGIGKEHVDWVVPHQANIRIIKSAARRLGVGMERVIVNLDRYGNMSSASIPVAFSEAVENGKFQPGDVIVLVGFGGGLTWGALVIEW